MGAGVGIVGLIYRDDSSNEERYQRVHIFSEAMTYSLPEISDI